MTSPLSILLLADDQRGAPRTIHDHIHAFRRYSRHRVRQFNPRNLARSRFLDLSEFDVVVVHYSLVPIWDDYLSPWFREAIARYDGLKVQFLQDEYRWVDETVAETRAMKIDVLYSVVRPNAVEAVYGGRLPDTEILFTLTGYVPDDTLGRRVPPIVERPIDVGYRGRSSPYWLGRLGNEKIEIGRGFLPLAEERGLRCDIAWSESARIYGEKWYEWIANCKTMLASESGSSIVDRDRSAQRAVAAYLAENPAATFGEVEAAVLGRYEGGPMINTVSPRIFETAAMRTGMVMFPGEYSGVVRPWDHYVPLEKDFANIDEVAEYVREPRLLEEMTSRAYDDLIGSGAYSYRRFVAGFDDDVGTRAGERRRRGQFPALALHAEQLTTGRSYQISSLYGLARRMLLASVATKQLLRRPALRRLVVRSRRSGHTPGSTSLWDDLMRLALLTSIHDGSLVPASGSFRVQPALSDGSLTLTSCNRLATLAPSTLEVRPAELREIIWNHASVGQYVTLSLPFVEKRISFDVGRYDAYGVYRFDQLLEVARRRPDLVRAALEPLLVTAPTRHQTSSEGEANP